jgi:RNase P/RNase MRP subunit p29
LSEQLQLRRGTSSQVAAFIGAQGETVMDTTNNRLVVSDGSTAGGWAAARLSEVITNTRTAVNDAPYSVLATDRMVAYTTLTGARVLTLPASNNYPTGTRLVIVDETGNCSTIRTLTVTPNGTDLIDGAAAAVVNVPYGFIGLESNQTGQWTIVDQGFMPALANVAAAAHGANIQIGVLETLVTLSGSSTNASVQARASSRRSPARHPTRSAFPATCRSSAPRYRSRPGRPITGSSVPPPSIRRRRSPLPRRAAASRLVKCGYRFRTCWPIRQPRSARLPVDRGFQL